MRYLLEYLVGSGVKSCFKSERRLGRKWPKVKTERNFGTGPGRPRIKVLKELEKIFEDEEEKESYSDIFGYE
jgi:hypothetical protein